MSQQEQTYAYDQRTPQFHTLVAFLDTMEYAYKHPGNYSDISKLQGIDPADAFVEGMSRIAENLTGKQRSDFPPVTFGPNSYFTIQGYRAISTAIDLLLEKDTFYKPVAFFPIHKGMHLRLHIGYSPDKEMFLQHFPGRHYFCIARSVMVLGTKTIIENSDDSTHLLSIHTSLVPDDKGDISESGSDRQIQAGVIDRYQNNRSTDPSHLADPLNISVLDHGLVGVFNSFGRPFPEFISQHRDNIVLEKL
jgi:hypothetical protein